MNFSIDPKEFAPLIEFAVDAAIRRLREERHTDGAGEILIDKRTVAEACSVSEATVDRWRNEAGFPCVKIDGKVLFRRSAVDAWAAARESK